MARLALLAALLGLAGVACHTPCDALGDRAERCRFAPGRTTDDRLSLCAALRGERATFDRFAECVTDAPCGEVSAIDRCQAEHLGAELEPCDRLRLWAAACALEPVGLDRSCSGLSDGMSAETFARWVACITAEGCPRGDDPRYDRCQELILPRSLTDTLDACVLYTAWTEACADQGPSFAPVAASSLAECVALAEPFTPQSFLAYATCLTDKACDDLAGRIECLLLLTFVDPTPLAGACQRLLDYADSCQSPVGGGSLEACTRLFARFTPASVDAYAACLVARGCDDQAAVYECLSLLQLN